MISRPVYMAGLFRPPPSRGLWPIYLLRGMRRFRPAYARLDTGGSPRHGRQCIPIRHARRNPLPPFCVRFSRRPSCHQRQAPPLHLTTAHEVYGRSNARRYASARWHVPGNPEQLPALLSCFADHKVMEQMTGFEPALSEWRSEVLPITPHLHNCAGGRTRTDTIRLPLYGCLAIAAQWFRRSIANVTRIKYPPLCLLSYAHMYKCVFVFGLPYPNQAQHANLSEPKRILFG